jgi:hypothetical protein
MAAEPCSESLRAHLFPAAVEKNEQSRCAAALAIEPGKQRVFALERLIAATERTRAALQISQSRPLKGIIRGEAGANVGQSDMHGEENIPAGRKAG